MSICQLQILELASVLENPQHLLLVEIIFSVIFLPPTIRKKKQGTCYIEIYYVAVNSVSASRAGTCGMSQKPI